MAEPRQLSEHQRRCLAAMGVPLWVHRGGGPIAACSAVAEVYALAEPTEAAAVPEVAEMDWPQLRATVSACVKCALHGTRTQTVFGVGSENADCLIVGEAPGADEDRLGEPFVGRAGQLLNAMLAAIGMRREDVYIANILKCRPPRNRDPSPEEMACCRPHLSRQIALVNPRVILAVGRIASQSLLDTTVPIGKLRGSEHTYREGDIPVVVTYHPAYLLRSPREKRKVWQDLKAVRRLLDGPG